MLLDPFAEMNRLRARLRRMLDESFPPPLRAVPEKQWTPQADIYATPEAVVVEMELPGTAREDIEIALHNATLSVRGHRARQTAESDEHYLHLERPAGRFARSFALGFEPSQVEAALADGVLTITLRRPSAANRTAQSSNGPR